MAQYFYTLPSGAEFTMTVANDITQTQADYIFYSQVAAGTFIGYSVGQQLTSLPNGQINFELSRLDRGTAGVDDVELAVILTLNQTPVVNPLNQADYVNVPRGYGFPAIGPLTPQQVQAGATQTVVTVDQKPDEVTVELGCGVYGQNTVQLEKAGYLKPGTATRFMDNDPIDLPNPKNFVQILQTPSVWTGKDGITSLDKYLADPIKQTQAQINLMQQSYKSLVGAGLVTDIVNNPVSLATGQVFSGVTGQLETLNAKKLLDSASTIRGQVSDALGNINVNNIGSTVSTALDSGTKNIGSTLTNLKDKSVENVSALLQNNVKYGLGQVDAWVKGVGTNLTNEMNNLGKMAQFAANFAQNKLSSLVAGVQAAAGYEGTVDRKVLDNAVSKVLGSDKIPQPEFTVPDLGKLDIAQAKAYLAQAQGAVNQVQGAVSTIKNQAQQLVAQAQGTVNAVTGQVAAVKNQAQNTVNNITNNFRV
jgi:hypothetical protein